MKKPVLLISLMFLIACFQIKAQELDDIVAEISDTIHLNEEQTNALKNQMGIYATTLAGIFDKYEGYEEPDPKAMLTEIKHEQEKYNAALKNDLGKEKFNEYTAFVEQVKIEILGEAAGIRLLDLQDPLKMTDDQLEMMKPVLGKAMRGVFGTLMKYIDKPLNIRNKLKIGSSLKSIKKTAQKETAAILSPEQIETWNAIKEAAKAEKEGGK